jgi:dihydrofolate reductase
MTKVVVINDVTLDGVMQSPGRADEDTRDGLTFGGWASANTDAVMMKALGARMGDGNRLLLGRRSYEDMLGHWNSTDTPFKDALNSAEKYVASRTLREPLRWPNSTLLQGDVADAVARLGRLASPADDVGQKLDDARRGISSWVEVRVVDGDAPAATAANSKSRRGDRRELRPGEPSGQIALPGSAVGRELILRQHVQVSVQPPA